MGFDTVGTPLLWGGFLAFVVAMLAVDLGVFHRHAHAVRLREAAVWSAVWVLLSAIFAVGVYAKFGSQTALEFTTGYLLEKALAVDNIFVFVVIFAAFAVPATQQHRVLFWGVLGALLSRAVFIVAGGAFLQRFHWAIYVFGGILLLAGIKLLVERNQETHPENNAAVRLVRRFVPISTSTNQRFTVIEDGRRYATPLLLALVAIEVSDIVFAVDSIPAVFAITNDPFIVFTSNIFAILGLRSMYFLLAGVIDKFHYLKVGLALVLVLVGVKMLAMDVYKLPILVSLLLIASILAVSIVASVLRPTRSARAEAKRPKAGPASAGADPHDTQARFEGE